MSSSNYLALTTLCRKEGSQLPYLYGVKKYEPKNVKRKQVENQMCEFATKASMLTPVRERAEEVNRVLRLLKQMQNQYMNPEHQPRDSMDPEKPGSQVMAAAIAAAEAEALRLFQDDVRSLYAAVVG